MPTSTANNTTQGDLNRLCAVAAKATGIALNTLMKWMKEPEFDAACRGWNPVLVENFR